MPSNECTFVFLWPQKSIFFPEKQQKVSERWRLVVSGIYFLAGWSIWHAAFHHFHAAWHTTAATQRTGPGITLGALHHFISANTRLVVTKQTQRQAPFLFRWLLYLYKSEGGGLQILFPIITWGWDVASPVRRTGKNINSNSLYSVSVSFFYYFSPSRSKHHSLKSAGAALILLQACKLSLSFSLDSLKGSPSFPFGFHCLLSPSSAGQITARYLRFECICQGSRVPRTLIDPSTEKWEVLSARRRWQRADGGVAGALNVCQCIPPQIGIRFLNSAPATRSSPSFVTTDDDRPTARGPQSLHSTRAIKCLSKLLKGNKAPAEVLNLRHRNNQQKY